MIKLLDKIRKYFSGNVKPFFKKIKLRYYLTALFLILSLLLPIKNLSWNLYEYSKTVLLMPSYQICSVLKYPEPAFCSVYLCILINPILGFVLGLVIEIIMGKKDKNEL